MIINKDSVTATRKLVEKGNTQEAIADIKKMIEIKQAHLWRSEGMAPCCGSLDRHTCQIANELEMLENTLEALESGDKAQAVTMLDGYIQVIEEIRKREPIEPQYS